MEDNSGAKRLIAYIETNDEGNLSAIENYLAERLPNYMLPSIYQVVDTIPLTNNGKINRRVMSSMLEESALVREVYEAPRNEQEEQLTKIWEKLLNRSGIGIGDDFFALGGHSLLGIQVVSAIRSKLGFEIDIADLFEYPTIKELAEYLAREGRALNLPPLVAKIRPEKIPLSYSQERLWFIDKFQGSTNYHIPFILRMSGQIQLEALNYAFQAIIRRHQILRTVYEEIDGRVYQKILDAGGWKWQYDQELEVQEKSEQERIIEKEIKKPFDLSSDFLLRVRLIKISAEEHLLVIVKHHIASDGWSTPIFNQELLTFYRSKLNGQPPNLSPITVQIR